MKRLKLKRPLVFFDLETTGAKVDEDRIVQIAAVKVYPEGHRDSELGDTSEINLLINPERPIPPEVIEIHGITDAMVKDAPTFKQAAADVASFFKNCDLAGYNVARFDIPLLINEFDRAGYAMRLDFQIVDAMKIYFHYEPRDLASAVKYYTGEEFEDHHDALADVKATMAVLEGQFRKYDDLPEDPEGLWAHVRDPDAVDFAGKLKWEGDRVVLTFGKNKGTSLQQLDTSYLSWMLKNKVIGPDCEHLIIGALRGDYPRRP